MKQRVLRFDGESLETLKVEAPGPIRWIARSAEWGDLLVGDRGGVIRRDGENFRRLDVPSGQNLRCVAISRRNGLGYACGNDGTTLQIKADVVSDTGFQLRGNLRRLSWDSTGEELLIVGNEGMAQLVDPQAKSHRVFGADTHLRSVAWHPVRRSALVTGNCFRDGIGSLTPSPNLFELDGYSLREISTLEESNADLTSSSWSPDGSSCLLAGFEQTWHTPALFTYSQGRMHVVPWEGPALFPTACSWNPDGRYALVGTSAITADEGVASLYRYSEGSVEKVEDLEGFGVSCIAWGEDGEALIACSRSTRAFNS